VRLVDMLIDLRRERPPHFLQARARPEAHEAPTPRALA
jgi:hypothetical protein